ncbi:MAG: hypothetical protein MK193_10380 [Lentisphaeria bacterium]|nr:hypothetical protein [Lentisphaeria bacterium]
MFSIRSLSTSLLIVGFSNGLLLGSYADEYYATNFEADTAFIDKLQQIRAKDLVELQFKFMEQTYANDKQALQFLGAKIQPNLQKRLDAYARIPKSSPYYSQALLQLATYEPNLEKRAKYIKEYVASAKPRNQEEQNQLNSMKERLIGVLVQSGNADEAIELITKKTSAEDQKKPAFRYQLAFITLMVADNYVKDKQPDKAKVEAQKAMKILEQLMWEGKSYHGILAYIEGAHAQLIMGDLKAAQTSLKGVAADAQAFENQLRKDGFSAAQSPMASYYFYYADLIMASAKNKFKKNRNDKESVGKLIKKGIELYDRVATRYVGAPVAKKALLKAQQAREILEKITGETVESTVDQTQLTKVAEEFYKQGKFDVAFEKYMVAAQSNLRSPDAALPLFFATVSLTKLDKLLEAKALASGMADYHPKHEKTPDALYYAAASLTKKAYATKDPKMKAIIEEDAIQLYAQLVDVAPTYTRSSVAANKVAEAEWRKATELNRVKSAFKKKLDASSGKNKKDLSKQYKAALKATKDAFANAIKYYETLTEHYATTAYGRKAFYRIGWIYYILGEKDLSIENFIAYTQAEESATYEKIDAVYLAAQQSFSEKDWPTARQYFGQTKDWAAPNSAFRKYQEEAKKVAAEQPATRRKALEKGIEQKITKIDSYLKTSTAMMGWSYEAEASNSKDKIEALEAQITGNTSIYEKYKNYEGEDSKVTNKAVVPKRVSSLSLLGLKPGIKPEGYEFDSYLDFTSSLTIDDYLFTMDSDGGFYLLHEPSSTLLCGVDGKGLKVKDLTSDTLVIEKQLLASYQSNRLVFVYDGETSKAREAERGEAPDILVLPKFEPLYQKERDFRLKRLEGKIEAQKKEASEISETLKGTQDQAIELLSEYVTKYPNDKSYTPSSMLLIGRIYLVRKDYETAQKWLNDLAQKFPDTEPGQQAPFSLFSAYMRAGETEKAAEIGQKLISRVKEMSPGVLYFMGFSLLTVNEKGEDECVDPNLSLAAIQEILARCDNPQADGHEKAKGWYERALYYKARLILLAEEPDYTQIAVVKDALIRVNEKSAYVLKVRLISADALRMSGKINDSRKEYAEIRKGAPKEQYPEYYFPAVLGSIQTYIESDKKSEVEEGILNLTLIFESIPLDKEEWGIYRQEIIYRLAFSNALVNNSEEMVKWQRQYLEDYSDGIYLNQISKMPDAKF